jgi:quercetin dioxygenase-like cupin family protein
MNDQLILSAINAVRQEFGHGPFAKLPNENAAEEIQKYLRSAPSINDDVLAITLYELKPDSYVVSFTQNPNSQVIAGEIWTWVMLDLQTYYQGRSIHIVSTDTIDRLKLRLPDAKISYS